MTVTGPGGVGKTRLVRELLAQDHLGAAVVDLAPAHTAADAVAAVASVLDVRAGPGQRLEDAVVDDLGLRPTLLVLDGCEHLLPGLGPVVERVLAAAPASTVLATSRDVLGADDEQVLPLSPLPVPDHAPDGDLGPAVRLFLDRARRVRAGAVPDEALPVVVELCRRLDGLPLAIELAAGQLGALGLHDLRDRLDDRLDLLATARRTSLRDVVDRSYLLLDEPQRRLFARLSVFEGGCTLEAAVAVGSDDGPDGSGTQVVHALRRLVDASMVAAHDDGSGRLRYALLETLRAYAAERLRESADDLPAARRHAAWAADLAEAAEPRLEGPGRGGGDGARRGRAAEPARGLARQRRAR